MNTASLSIGLMLAGGAMLAIQGPINGALVRAVGSPINAALVSFAVGTLVLLAVAASQQVSPSSANVRALPWWGWLGGMCGAAYVAAAAFAAPRIGVASMLTLAVAGQVVVAILLDAMGAFGVTPRPISVLRLIGVALVLVGTALVRRS